jgi:hypothetical protein
MVQFPHFRERDDRPVVKQLHRSGMRRVHGQRQMRPPAMVILEVAGEDASEMVVTEDDQFIQARPPVAPDYALRKGMGPGGPAGR